VSNRRVVRAFGSLLVLTRSNSSEERAIVQRSGAVALATKQQSRSQGLLVFSYMELRKAVGIMGLALPFVLAFGKILLGGHGIERSISDYYYTDMRGVLVGILWAIGVFLLSTRGYDRKDEIAGQLAFVFALGTALFPIAPDEGATQKAEIIGVLHWSCAALLFLTLAYFSVVLFTKTNPDTPPTSRKLQRNKLYRLSGYTIVACVLLIGVVSLKQLKPLFTPFHAVFWLETCAIVAFGVSWLTKGEMILADKG
jgi:hypothetical protein